MSDKRVESLQIGVDEVTRLRRERDEAVGALEEVLDDIQGGARKSAIFTFISDFLYKRKEG